MNKFKKATLFLITALMTATVAVMLVGCNKNSDYPIYKNPVTNTYSGKYIVSVQSMGSLKLNGVAVTAKKDGVSVMEGISVDGIIEFALPKDSYDLVVDESSLPEGYYIPEDAQFKTTPEESNAVISLPSRIIPTTAVTGTQYRLGDVMHEFAYLDTSGEIKTLSQALQTKKAVMLNFWYSTCGPCQSEFPAMQSAYEAYSGKLSIIALSNSDSLEEILEFKTQRNLTFDMAPDQAGIPVISTLRDSPPP